MTEITSFPYNVDYSNNVDMFYHNKVLVCNCIYISNNTLYKFLYITKNDKTKRIPINNFDLSIQNYKYDTMDHKVKYMKYKHYIIIIFDILVYSDTRVLRIVRIDTKNLNYTENTSNSKTVNVVRLLGSYLFINEHHYINLDNFNLYCDDDYKFYDSVVYFDKYTLVKNKYGDKFLYNLIEGKRLSYSVINVLYEDDKLFIQTLDNKKIRIFYLTS